MGSKRLNGTKLSVKIDKTEYKGDVTEYKFTNDDKDADVTTFEDMEHGNSGQFFLEIGLVQSTDATSLFMKLWENEGKECEFVLAPHGNEEPSKEQPHVKGKLIIPRAPELGGAAGKTPYTSTVKCDLTGKPEFVTTPSLGV
ncbi:hypothetical protein [Trueperella pyogenes]|uniref:hypothetical protein n=1 Tax=Trueperella pyogenes TaxID=1661 RepID=UPI00312B6238